MRKVIVQPLLTKRMEDLPVEIVERKGKGHPDTLCDRMAEELSVSLCNYYLQKFGRIFHHNVDKCVLAGGKSSPEFGGGEIIDPIYLLLVGRAVSTVGEVRIPLEDLVRESAERALKQSLRFMELNKHIQLDFKIKQGSAALVGTFDNANRIPLANDTSLAVAFAPFSQTERLVYETEQLLNSAETKKKHPEIGEDIKVMGVRSNSSIRLTLAIAYVSRFVKTERQYWEAKGEAQRLVEKHVKNVTQRKVVIDVNPADNRKKKIAYLTVTGTSAEGGDDGQVGRGNRANGLITPYRPMTLEATAGKNPVSHVGKIYNVVAQKICDQLVKKKGVEEASCYLVSQIAHPIDEPQVVDLKVRSNLSQAKLGQIARDASDEVFSKIGDLWEDFLKRRFSLF